MKKLQRQMMALGRKRTEAVSNMASSAQMQQMLKKKKETGNKQTLVSSVEDIRLLQMQVSTAESTWVCCWLSLLSVSVLVFVQILVIVLVIVLVFVLVTASAAESASVPAIASVPATVPVPVPALVSAMAIESRTE